MSDGILPRRLTNRVKYIDGSNSMIALEARVNEFLASLDDPGMLDPVCANIRFVQTPIFCGVQIHYLKYI